MQDKRNLHQKVQEMCDCFVTADPVREMMTVKTESDEEEAAVKWLALAILYGIDSHARKISLSSTDDGEVEVRVKYRDSALPAPSPDFLRRVMDTVKEIAHLEGEGKTPLALGIRDSSIEIGVKAKQEEGCNSVTLKFPA